jgi:hypothetical protein
LDTPAAPADPTIKWRLAVLIVEGGPAALKAGARRADDHGAGPQRGRAAACPPRSGSE